MKNEPVSEKAGSNPVASRGGIWYYYCILLLLDNDNIIDAASNFVSRILSLLSSGKVRKYEL
jgi:hypothetical protein